jgi:pyruvate dehydrogenase E1 component alpha subunit
MAKTQTSESNVKKTAGNKAYSKELLMRFYNTMVKIRRFEEKAGQLYGMGLIGGFCHLYIGQEAIVTGMQEAIIKGDQVITTYRDHGHMVACGTEMVTIFGELMGREIGCSRGKGGSMHMFDLKNEFYGGHGIVGANVPIGTGLAFANKYRNKNNISVTYFGDGAANQGQVYESFNMASLWKLPAIYIIENNEYAMGTSTKRGAAKTEFFRRGEGFGIKGEQVDGMDVMAVYEAGKRIAEHVRTTKEPYILEMKTYRYRGHSMSDPAKYRSKEEVECVKEQKDPIENLKKYIVSQKFATIDELENLDKKIRAEINEIVEVAKASPEPDPAELFTDILS